MSGTSPSSSPSQSPRASHISPGTLLPSPAAPKAVPKSLGREGSVKPVPLLKIEPKDSLMRGLSSGENASKKPLSDYSAKTDTRHLARAESLTSLSETSSVVGFPYEDYAEVLVLFSESANEPVVLSQDDERWAAGRKVLARSNLFLIFVESERKSSFIERGSSEPVLPAKKLSNVLSSPNLLVKGSPLSPRKKEEISDSSEMIARFWPSDSAKSTGDLFATDDLHALREVRSGEVFGRGRRIRDPRQALGESSWLFSSTVLEKPKGVTFLRHFNKTTKEDSSTRIEKDTFKQIQAFDDSHIIGLCSKKVCIKSLVTKKDYFVEMEAPEFITKIRSVAGDFWALLCDNGNIIVGKIRKKDGEYRFLQTDTFIAPPPIASYTTTSMPSRSPA